MANNFLDLYFKRIGYSRSPVVNLQTLRDLHLLHLQQIPYENGSSLKSRCPPTMRMPSRKDAPSGTPKRWPPDAIIAKIAKAKPITRIKQFRRAAEVRARHCHRACCIMLQGRNLFQLDQPIFVGLRILEISASCARRIAALNHESRVIAMKSQTIIKMTAH